MLRSKLTQLIADENPHLFPRDVELRGFGAFSVRKRDARHGRNPRTGEAVEVDQKYVPFFKTGKPLHDRLNGEA